MAKLSAANMYGGQPSGYLRNLRDAADYPGGFKEYDKLSPDTGFLKGFVLPAISLAGAYSGISQLGAGLGGASAAGTTATAATKAGGGFLGNILKGVTWENALKLLKNPMVSGYIMQQLFPNPANKRIGALQSQLDASRAASLAGINNMGYGPGVVSGGNASRMWSAQAGSGTTGGTMAGVNGGYVQNALARAAEDRGYRQADARRGVEDSYYNSAMGLERYKSQSDSDYAQTLAELGALFGWG